MLWTPARVAGFASVAGFTGRDLARATALALAVSGGDDGYAWRAGVPVVVDQRGLWGLDVAAHGELGYYDLYRPDVNAGRAYELYVACGRTFSGFPHPTGSALEAVIPVALAAASRPALTQAVATTPPVGGPGSSFVRAWNGTLALLDRITQPVQLR